MLIKMARRRDGPSLDGLPLLPRPDVLYCSLEMYDRICRWYGNMTVYVAKEHGRELKRELRLDDDTYVLELGPAVPVLAPKIRRFG